MKSNSEYLNILIVGSPSEIHLIYERCFPMVQKFIFQNKGNEEDAKDIFQKALLQLAVRYRKEKFEIKTSFEAYFFTVCKNLWRRELNKSKSMVTNQEVRELKDNDQDMALALLEQKRWELFHDSLTLISENCKKILEYFFAKKPYKEMMAEFNYSSETVVRQRVFKCKAKLKELIKKDSRYKSLIEL